MRGSSLMKVKIINENMANFNEEFKVKNINYDMVVAEVNEEKLYFNQEDVAIISENIYEDAILKCKDVIKIKLGRGISLLFYTAVLDTLKQRIEEEVTGINLLKDEFRELRKGLWEKSMLMVVNEKFSLSVSVIGRKYGKHFDITIRDYNLRNFIDECCHEIEYLKKEIEEKEQIIERYRKGMKDVMYNYCNCSNKALLMDPKLSDKALRSG
jgi:hypothetical protein